MSCLIFAVITKAAAATNQSISMTLKNIIDSSCRLSGLEMWNRQDRYLLVCTIDVLDLGDSVCSLYVRSAIVRKSWQVNKPHGKSISRDC